MTKFTGELWDLAGRVLRTLAYGLCTRRIALSFGADPEMAIIAGFIVTMGFFELHWAVVRLRIHITETSLREKDGKA